MINNSKSILCFAVVVFLILSAIEATENKNNYEVMTDGEPVFKNSCLDTHDNCSFWAKEGECQTNPNYMLSACMKSCMACSDNTTLELDEFGLTVAQNFEMKEILAEVENYGVAQEVDFPQKKLALFVIRRTISYMKVFVNAKHPTHRLSNERISKCKNNYPECSAWASAGECETNETVMIFYCGPACRLCHKIEQNWAYRK